MLRKRIILILLLVCIGISGYLVSDPSFFNRPELQSLDEIDQIIEAELIEFNIKQAQIRHRQAGVEKGFDRQIVQVNVPTNFSKTFFHSELAYKLGPYGIRTPSIVELPSGNMNIHIYWMDTVVRTIELRHNGEFVRYREPGVILLESTTEPSSELLEKLALMGEPIRLVLRSDNADVLLSWMDLIPRSSKPPIIHLDYGVGVGDLKDDRFDRFVGEISRINKQWSNTAVLLSLEDTPVSDARIKRLQRTGAHVVQVKKSLPVAERITRDEFRELLAEFVSQSRAGQLPVLVIPGKINVLDWLQQDLVNYKKGGLNLAEPEFIL
jgi:hypothetical protein